MCEKLVNGEIFPPSFFVKSAGACGVNGNAPQRQQQQQQQRFSVSAPGKVILFGEHAVVYGRTAIAGSINLRTTLQLEMPAASQLSSSTTSAAAADDVHQPHDPDADAVIKLSLPDLYEGVFTSADMRSSFDEADDAQGPPPLEIVVPIVQKLISAGSSSTPGTPRTSGGVERGGADDAAFVRGKKTAVLVFWYLLAGALVRSRMRPFPVEVSIRSELPHSMGLGSSGSFCACLAAALLTATRLVDEPNCSAEIDEEDWLTFSEDGVGDQQLELIRRWATAAESLVHGKSSGLDVAVCLYGGIASYSPGRRIETLQNELPGGLRLLLVNSGVERNTSKLVSLVSDKRHRLGPVFDSIFDAIEHCALEAARTIEQRPPSRQPPSPRMQHQLQQQHVLLIPPPSPGATSLLSSMSLATTTDGGRSPSPPLPPAAFSEQAPPLQQQQHQRLPVGCSISSANGAAGGGGAKSPDRRSPDIASASTDAITGLDELARINNHLLEALGVGHKRVEQICTLLARYGIHAKMTGAGGGGCLFAFIKPDISMTVREMIARELGAYRTWHTQLGGPGLLFHRSATPAFASPSNQLSLKIKK